uniref:Uncharacterized protein n=1 Tax=Rhizophora mucronata TaxID=61149 RepID=A0A2P2R523_RHIMU
MISHSVCLCLKTIGERSQLR